MQGEKGHVKVKSTPRGGKGIFKEAEAIDLEINSWFQVLECQYTLHTETYSVVIETNTAPWADMHYGHNPSISMGIGFPEQTETIMTAMFPNS